nr:uncharacterized protein LOC115261394 [Aedes albopictus]
MFGRKIRTSFELLRPPPVRTPVPTSNDSKQPRYFHRDDPVYAKLHVRNGWKWVPGKIIEKIEDVMYNVWVENRRMLRSHINQLRSRMATDTTPMQSAGQVTSRQHSLPLDILLGAWNLSSHSPSTPTSAAPPIAPRSVSVSSPEPTPIGSEPACASSMPRHELPAVPSTSSSSPTSTSTDFESAIKVEPMVELPRRSSRTRRPPVRFDSNQLY